MDYFFSLIYSIFILFSLLQLNIIYNSYNSNEIDFSDKEITNNNKLYNSYNKNSRQLSSLTNESLLNISNSYHHYFLKKKFLNLWNTQLKEKFFDGEVNYTYLSGQINNITNTTLNTTYNTGYMNLRLFFPNEGRILQDENPTFKMRILENKTIDKWIFIAKYIKLRYFFDIYDEIEKINENISMHYYNETFFNLSYMSRFEHGEYFGLPFNKTICNISYTFNFLLNSINKTNNNKTWNEKEISGIKGSLYSKDCKIKMEFNLEKHSNTYYKLYNHIFLYCLFSAFLSLFHSICTKIFINKIDFSAVNHSSISIFTVCQNIIWNSYCCYSHFYLLLSFIEFKFFFGIICTLYFFNFGVYEFPLLYQLLALKYSHMINDVLTYRKKLIQFCFIFYLTMLFCFIFAMKCFYSTNFIFCSFAFTFIPQIVYNINKKNRVSFPIIYIIDLILNRIYPSFYFCMFKNNFLRIPTNKISEIFNIIFLLSLSGLLYSQTLFGPEWFFPIKDITEFNFYLDEKELRKIKKNETDSLECLICLLPIIPQKKINANNKENNNDNGFAFNETDNLVIEINDNNIISTFDNKKCCKFKYSNRCFGEKSILLNFHEFSKNINNLPYMITPCKHVFHSDCLEEWFKMKKECPSCRNIITQEMYD